jgi:glycosyltransferase involved in cell wall biosynthesis
MIRVAILTTDNREHHRRYELPSPYFGPAIEAVLQGLARRNELEIHVISCTQQPMSAPEKVSDNMWFHLLHVPKIGWLRTGYQGCIRAIRKKLREIQPDLVHGQGTERECAISAASSGFPNVISIHGNMARVARAAKARIGSYLWCAAILERFTLPKTNGVLCNSAYTESVVAPQARRTWRVANALRDDFFDTPLPATGPITRPILLNIGVISPYKRQLELLEVAELLHSAGHAFQLQFLGQLNRADAYAAAFLRRLEKTASAGFAKYLEAKALPDLIALFDSASALIHTPSEEAFGLVLAEALARNLKVFGTAVGGLPDIASGLEAAELFPLHDHAGLRDAMAKWLTQGCPRPPAAAAEMKLRYHSGISAEQHVKIYAEVIATTKK